jgi:hypothetical protein
LLATIGALDTTDVFIAHQIGLGTNLEGIAATIANHHVADARKLHLDSLRARLLATVRAVDITDILIAHQIDLGTNLKSLVATIANNHAVDARRLQAIECERFTAPNVITHLNPSLIVASLTVTTLGAPLLLFKAARDHHQQPIPHFAKHESDAASSVPRYVLACAAQLR